MRCSVPRHHQTTKFPSVAEMDRSMEKVVKYLADTIIGRDIAIKERDNAINEHDDLDKAKGKIFELLRTTVLRCKQELDHVLDDATTLALYNKQDDCRYRGCSEGSTARGHERSLRRLSRPAGDVSRWRIWQQRLGVADA